MNIKKTFLKIATEKLNPYGYEYFDDPKVQDVSCCFLRKDLGNNVYAFIQFQQHPYVNAILNGKQLPRRFSILFWKNIGDKPRYGDNKNEKNLENWLFLSLPYLLWSVLKLKIFKDPNYIWEYYSEEELIVELEDAMEKTIQYGIPWLEDPNSRNPYPYEPPNP